MTSDFSSRPWWRFPWGYRESLAYVAGLMVVGVGLQFAAPLDIQQWRRPVSLALAAVLALAALPGAFRPKNRLAAWLASAPLAVSLIGALGLLALVLGLTPQGAAPGPDAGWPERLGLTRLTSSWPFILLYLAAVVSLGLVVTRRLVRRGPKLAFLANHFGLWLVLAAAALGAADRQTYTLWVEEGQVEWRGRTPWGLVVELPVAVRLIDFELEEYPPRLALVDRQTGRPQPEARPDWYQIDPGRLAPGRLAGWEVTVDEYQPRGLRSQGGVYLDSPRPEASPAALVTARPENGGEPVRGWVTDGGPMQPFQSLDLGPDLALVMARPEPKRFASQVTVFSREGERREAVLEVNQPLRVGSWLIYQHSYDERMGRLSRHSGLELVHDPWLLPVQVGLGLMALGALTMIWRGRRRP